jgi:hypothetical protein
VNAPIFDPDALLLALCTRGVAFVVVGGWAAGVHSVGWTTFDLDVVIDDSHANHEATATALADIDAVFDTAHRPPIRADVERIRSATGAMLLRTRHGRLDVLKEAAGETYKSLIVDAVRLTLGGVHEFPVASLAAIARMKRAANRPKDREVLPRIEAALRDRHETTDDE